MMIRQSPLRLSGAVIVFVLSANTTHALIHLNFDEDIYTAPIGTPLIRITATLDLDGQHYLYGGTSHGYSTAVWATPSFSYGPLPGETSYNEQIDNLKAQFGELPGLVPADGDHPASIPFVWGYWHLDDWDIEAATGYPGYISASGSFESQSINDQYRVEFYVNTEPGYSSDVPLLPDVVQPDGRFDFTIDMTASGLGQNFPVYIDPVAAIGYRYTVGPGDPLFSVVLIPQALPLGDSDFELLVDGSSYPLTAGVPFDLMQIVPGGVSTFTIMGIDPAEALDPNDPAAFPTGLMFVGPGTAHVSMLPIPSPQTLGLLGVCGLGGLLRRRTG